MSLQEKPGVSLSIYLPRYADEIVIRSKFKTVLCDIMQKGTGLFFYIKTPSVIRTLGFGKPIVLIWPDADHQ